MAPPDVLFAGSLGSGKRSVAKEEAGGSMRSGEDDNEPDLLKLSPVGEVLRRAHAHSLPHATARRRMHTARPSHSHRTRTARPCLSTRRVPYARQVLRRATEAGSGVLSVGRPWVRHEG